MAITTTAPIFKLPTEILAEIFCTAVAGQISHLTGIETPIPASLSFVCRLWREISVGLPQLWASIAFDSQENPKIALPELLDLYLSRSRNTSLSIHGTLLRDRDSLSFDAILRQSRRWRTVHLHFSPAYIPQLNTVQHQVPKLESLSLDLTHPIDDRRWLDYDIMAFLDAPSLRSIAGCDRALRHIMIPSDQVNALTAYVADLRFSTILAGSYRNLRQLTLRNWQCPPNFTVVPDLELRALCLVQDRESISTSLSQIFALFVLPQLHTLHVEGCAAPRQRLDWDVIAFADMTGRFMPFPLTTLRLSHVFVSDVELIASLLCLPMLETLVVVERGHSPSTISDTFLKNITWPCLACPELKMLNLSGQLQFDDSCLLDMVKSRLHPDSGAHESRTAAKLLSLSVATSYPERLGLIKTRLFVLRADLILDLTIIEDRLQNAVCPDCHYL